MIFHVLGYTGQLDNLSNKRLSADVLLKLMGKAKWTLNCMQSNRTIDWHLHIEMTRVTGVWWHHMQEVTGGGFILPNIFFHAQP
jgi:hypothetical protein